MDNLTLIKDLIQGVAYKTHSVGIRYFRLQQAVTLWQNLESYGDIEEAEVAREMLASKVEHEFALGEIDFMSLAAIDDMVYVNPQYTEDSSLPF